MKVPDNLVSERLSWVDYCDSLSNEHFISQAALQKPPPALEQAPDHAAFVACLRDMARELS